MPSSPDAQDVRKVDLRSLGGLVSTTCTESYGLFVFEHGRVAVSVEAWFELRRFFGPPQNAAQTRRNA